MSSLAPCPGCGRCSDGSNDYVIGGDPRLPENVHYRQICSCGWWGPEATTLDAARAAWNRRTTTLRWHREPPDAPGWWFA